MVSTGTKLTLEEFLALPEGDVTYEFINGQAVPKVSPKSFHSFSQIVLGMFLHLWSKSRGRVGSEWAIRLQRNGADWAPVPDLTYISYERLPRTWQKNEACPVPPELVIEILSPDQTVEEFEEKAKDYFKAGVLRMWLVDPEQQTITVFSSQQPAKVYRDTMPITDDLLSGLELTTQQIFEEADIL